MLSNLLRRGKATPIAMIPAGAAHLYDFNNTLPVSRFADRIGTWNFIVNAIQPTFSATGSPSGTDYAILSGAYQGGISLSGAGIPTSLGAVSFSWLLRIKIEAYPATGKRFALVNKKIAGTSWTGYAPLEPFDFYITDTGQVKCDISMGALGTIAATVNSGAGIVPLNTWTYVTIVHNRGTSLSIGVGNSPIQTTLTAATVQDTADFTAWKALTYAVEGSTPAIQTFWENCSFIGQCDEIRLWRRALTLVELQALHV